MPPCLDKPIEYAPALGDCVVNCMKMHTVWDYPQKMAPCMVYIYMVNLWLSATKKIFVLVGWLFSMCNKELKDQTIQGWGCLSHIYPLVN